MRCILQENRNVAGAAVGPRREGPVDMLGEIGAKCEMLAEMPHVGHSRPDLHPELRCSVAGSYVIFYREVDGGIEVARVLHGRRDFGAIDFGERMD